MNALNDVHTIPQTLPMVLFLVRLVHDKCQLPISALGKRSIAQHQCVHNVRVQYRNDHVACESGTNHCAVKNSQNSFQYPPEGGGVLNGVV